MKILVIRFHFIGDVVLSSVLCSSLKKSFPEAQVDYLVYEVSKPLFEQHASVDNVIGISHAERRNPIRYLNKVVGLAKQRYDIIIDATSTGKSELVSIFSLYSKFKIGRPKKGRGFSYTHTVSDMDADKVQQRLALLKPLEQAGLPIIYEDSLVIEANQKKREAFLVQMYAAGVEFDRPLFIFSVSAKLDQKKWRLDYQRQVATYCLERYNAQIILYAGSPEERTDIDLFYHQMDGHHAQKSIFHQFDTPTLADLAALFSCCDMFIGNEGGPRHIAQGLQIPSVAVFSPSAGKKQWLPASCDRYQGIEWRDVIDPSTINEQDIEYGNSLYYRLYNSIEPRHVQTKVDQVIQKHISKNVLIDNVA